MKKVWVLTLAAALVVMHPLAEARRMGSGSSIGKQSSNVTQRQATPPAAPARPAQQQNAQQNNAAAKPAAPAAAPAKKPWGAMLGGLAACRCRNTAALRWRPSISPAAPPTRSSPPPPCGPGKCSVPTPPCGSSPANSAGNCKMQPSHSKPDGFA